MNAYVLIHFGNNPKYLEYELYFLENLRMYTNYDIIYLYSINDTPTDFIDAIKKLQINIIFKSYQENTLINNNKNIKNNASYDDRFKVIRTCNFIFAYKLTSYNKICILESDMIIYNNIDDIFNLKSISVRHTKDKYVNVNLNKNIIPALRTNKFDVQNFIESSKSNNKIIVDKTKLPRYCNFGSILNGGVLVIQPNNKHYNHFKKNY